MKSLIVQRTSVVALIVLSLAGLLVSCSPNAEEPIISPQLGAILAARETGGEITIPPTPTPVLLSTLAEDQITAGLPDDVLTALASADVSRASAISLNAGCVGCHSLNPDEIKPGPTWNHVGDTAVGRVDGESPALYLYISIVDPSAYVVPDFQDGIMPKDFGQRLSTQELADLIAFLLEQRQ
jgi:cytochrome c551/c552